MYIHSLWVPLLLASTALADPDKDGTAATGPTSTPGTASTTPMKYSTTLQPQSTDLMKQYGPPDARYLQSLQIHIYTGPTAELSYYYDPRVRPNLFNRLDIHTRFYLSGITHVDEKTGSFKLTGVLIMEWIDDRLTWDPAQFGNITTVQYDGYMVWSPRFFHNGLTRDPAQFGNITTVKYDGYTIWSPRFFHNGNYFLRQRDAVLRTDVRYDGLVFMVVSMHEEIPCLFDMTKFPRDNQTCYVQLYHSDPLVNLNADDAAKLEFDDQRNPAQPHHKAWKVTGMTMESHPQIAGTDSGEVLLITIMMERQPNFYLRIYVAPICFLLLLIPLIFLLPPDSPEKMTFGAILLFCMVFISQSLESLYPPYTDNTPYLIRLTNASNSLLFVCILLTSLITSAERIGRKRALPPWMKRYVVGVIGPFLLVRENDASHGTVHIKSSADNDREFIVQTEQSMDVEERNGGINTTELTGADDNNQALQALVHELKQSRLQSKTFDEWTNVFTILNRILFLLTLLIGIIIALCFA